MEVIHIKPSKTLAERIGNWSTEADFSQVAEVLDVADSIAEAFRDRNLDSTPPQLDVVIRPESKWQDVNSHYHSANLVLLLLLPFLIPQTHFMLHLSIVPFFPLYYVVNPCFIHLIFLFAPPPTNLVGVPALSLLLQRILNPFPFVGLLVSALGSSCHHYADPTSLLAALLTMSSSFIATYHVFLL
jgi:hypothetical protein